MLPRQAHGGKFADFIVWPCMCVSWRWYDMAQFDNESTTFSWSKYITSITFRELWLLCRTFFLHEIGGVELNTCSGSVECIHDSFTIRLWYSFVRVGNGCDWHHMYSMLITSCVWSLLCTKHCFPRRSLRMRNTLARKILTSVNVALYNAQNTCSQDSHFR